MAEGPRRRASDTDFGELCERVAALESDARSLHDELAENTRATKQVRADTAELVEMFRAAQGAWKVLEFLGKLAKPVAALGAFGAFFYGIWVAIKAQLPAIFR